MYPDVVLSLIRQTVNPVRIPQSTNANFREKMDKIPSMNRKLDGTT